MIPIGNSSIVIPMSQIIYCELLPNIFGVAIALSTNNMDLPGGPVFQFNNMGKESGKLACYLIQEMMDGIRNNNERKRIDDSQKLTAIEEEMERKAI